MGIFSRLYDFCFRLSQHPKAPWFLCLDSFMESFFWPVPPDVMLLPMCLSRRTRALRYAWVTTLSSVMGAVCGYYLGYFLYDPFIADLITRFHYQEQMETVRAWFTLRFGVLMVFVGAFTPIPYKVIAITAGAVAAESVAATGGAGMLNIFIFIAVSLCGRGGRFFLEAGLIAWGGARMERLVRRYVDYLGWLCVLALCAYAAYKYFA